jgi:hypothetical protein
VSAPEATVLGTGHVSMAPHEAICPSYGLVPELKPEGYPGTLYTKGAKNTCVVILRARC